MSDGLAFVIAAVGTFFGLFVLFRFLSIALARRLSLALFGSQASAILTALLIAAHGASWKTVESEMRKKRPRIRMMGMQTDALRVFEESLSR